jgi:spermidine/putrescine transport system substrate-binding protein
MLAALVVGHVALVAGTATAKPSQVTLTISNWDAYTPESLIPAFEKATGIKVKLAKHTTNEDIMGKLEAQNGGGYDIVFVSGPFAESLKKRGWAAKLDRKQIPNLKNLYPSAFQLAYDKGNRYSVPYTWGTTGLCWRSDLTKTPKSWNDLLKPSDALKGKITMLQTDRWLMLPALKVLGYSLNTVSPAKLDKAADLLKEAKKNLLAYDDTTFYSKLVSGEAHMVQAWDGWCNYGIAENPKIKFMIPKEGSDVFVDTMVVLEKSKNKEAAHKFLDWVLRPDSGKAVTELVLFGIRGKGNRTLPPGRSQPNILVSRKREHSRKPDELYRIIEACSPPRYVELFARHSRPGWSSIGNEIDAPRAPAHRAYRGDDESPVLSFGSRSSRRLVGVAR